MARTVIRGADVHAFDARPPERAEVATHRVPTRRSHVIEFPPRNQPSLSANALQFFAFPGQLARPRDAPNVPSGRRKS